jgi:MoxR-like ATPase
MEHPERKIEALIDALASVIRGNRESVELLVISLLSNGSVLLQDVPGVGKTTLAKAVAKAVDVPFHRVQFTPDLLPADILGASVYNPVEGSFTFRPGAGLLQRAVGGRNQPRLAAHPIGSAGSDERVACHDRGKAA